MSQADVRPAPGAAEAPVHHTWSASDRFVPRRMVRPLQRLLDHEAAGGAVMLVAATVAIAWANSPWSGSYEALWSTSLRVELGDLLHLDHLDLRAWVNDALMTLFFLLVGVEIKREAVHGELRDVRSITLPVAAALGGMVVPAIVYAAFNAGSDASGGWGIPMATDIAFAVGVVSLAGPRVPAAARLFLLTLAVADDVGAIVVIAVFYAEGLSIGWFAVALAALALIGAMRRADVQALAPYLAVGALLWLALLESGVHATLAGVALGLMTPAWPLQSPHRYPTELRRLTARIERSHDEHGLTERALEEHDHHAAEVVRLTLHSTSPLARLERGLAPWVALVVVPVFALANAGVGLSADTLGDLVSDRVTLGVALGLAVGKLVGVLGATALAVRSGLGRLPVGTTWRHVVGLATCAGVGFTVALFVASLSFPDAGHADAAKVGILAGSLLAGVAGFLVLRSAPPAAHEPADDAAVEPAAVTGCEPAVAPVPASAG